MFSPLGVFVDLRAADPAVQSMAITTRRLAGSMLTLALGLGTAMTPAVAQMPAAGNVSRLEGTAAVARTAAAPAPLKARDDVYLRDLVTTGAQSKAQLLLGRKAMITMREQSALRITEVPGVATVEMTDGRLRLALLKDRLKPGERIDVKTPNAITAVRGTVVVVEVVPASSGATSRVTALSGFVEVWTLDPATGQPSGAPLRLNALQQTTVSGLNAPSPPQPISRSEAQLIDATYAFGLKPGAPTADVLKKQADQAAKDAALVQTSGGNLVPSGSGGPPEVSGDAIRSRNAVTPPPPSRPMRPN
jgi:hypothetical protein